MCWAQGVRFTFDFDQSGRGGTVMVETLDRDGEPYGVPQTETMQATRYQDGVIAASSRSSGGQQGYDSMSYWMVIDGNFIVDFNRGGQMAFRLTGNCARK